MLETLHKKLPILLPVAGYVLLAHGSAFAADAKQGKAIAERWCASCHVVEQKQRSAATDQAPPFASIAAKPDFNAGRLAFLLLKPHPNMPQLALSRSEATDLAEYMLTLK
jgi:mono/diheme cytochrome c family protein